MKRILVATDFSTRAQHAIRRAGMLAKQYSAEVILCHVVDDDQPERLQKLETEEALRILDEMKNGVAELQGVSCTTSVVLGDAFDGIIRAGENRQADLIAIGSHRRHLLRDFFLGTTAERVMRRGSLPVLLVNRPPAHLYHRILMAVDLSDVSAQAFAVARDLGILAGAQVMVFHSFDAMLTTLATASVSQEKIDEHLADATMNARREVEQFLAKIDLQGMSFSIHVHEGAPALTIKDAVGALHPNLVVLGTRGRTGGIARLVLGSVAEEAIRELDIDVLAVPPPVAPRD